MPAILRRSSGLGAIFADSSRFQPSATGIPACWQICAATVIAGRHRVAESSVIGDHHDPGADPAQVVDHRGALPP